MIALVIACSSTACTTAKQDSASLQAEAKLSRVDAEKIALARVPGGTIKEGEIEKENGRIIWSFDIATTGSPDVTEVQVDAMSGKIVAVDKETPAQQAQEKKKDAQEKSK